MTTFKTYGEQCGKFVDRFLFCSNAFSEKFLSAKFSDFHSSISMRGGELFVACVSVYICNCACA